MDKKLEKLDSRLQAAYDYVSEETTVADIGTDHGYLICHLIYDGKANKGYATDINIEPLKSAVSLIRSLNLEDRIDAILSDGLEKVPDDARDIVICGMGGDNIIGILEKCSWIKRPSTHLILQPMTKMDEVRKWLCENGWYIDSETAVESGGHLYTVMSSGYDGIIDDVDELYYYVGKLPENSSAEAVKYIRWQASIQKEIAEGLLKSGHSSNRAMSHFALADMLNDEADDMQMSL